MSNTNPVRYDRTEFNREDAVGNPLKVGSQCKVFRHYQDSDGEVYREDIPVGTVFTVDVLEDVGYRGYASVGINGDGWIHHGMILVV